MAVQRITRLAQAEAAVPVDSELERRCQLQQARNTQLPLAAAAVIKLTVAIQYLAPLPLMAVGLEPRCPVVYLMALTVVLAAAALVVVAQAAQEILLQLARLKEIMAAQAVAAQAHQLSAVAVVAAAALLLLALLAPA